MFWNSYKKLKGRGTYLAKTKGKVLVLLMDIILKNCFSILSQKPLEALGLKVVNGNTLGRKADRNLSEELRQVKQNLLIDYGEFEPLLPDADIIIYKPENSQVIAIISSKISLRERIAHTGYWKLKILKSQKTERIKLYLITLDKDKHLTEREHPKRQRIIVETELDGTYVLTAEPLQESNKVKLFEHFIEDLKQVIGENQ